MALLPSINLSFSFFASLWTGFNAAPGPLTPSPTYLPTLRHSLGSKEEKMTTSYGPPYGVAIRRNGTCDSAANEVKCSVNWDPWHVCCPENTVCGTGGLCCPTDSDCSAPIMQDPHCANNATWDLYNLGGYFCCDSRTNGFEATNLVYNGSQVSGVGCAEGYPSGEYTNVLVPVARGNGTDSDSDASSSPSPSSTPSPTQSQPTTTPSPTITDNPEAGSSSSSSTNKGAIAGGVVGGVVGAALIIALIWFLLRRRRKSAAENPGPGPGPDTPYTMTGKEQFGAQAELENNIVRAELYGNYQDGLPHELPARTPAR
ncbi:hypothetical protein BJX61DRAFT_516650 [Aspergillus egyptiacus]|nr:hypothetical protein BJX61DRAFT_516650 [Aspergillus egyptiacus]